MAYLRLTGLTWVLLAFMKLVDPTVLVSHLKVDWGMSDSMGLRVAWLVIVSEALLGAGLILSPPRFRAVAGYISIAAAALLAMAAVLWAPTVPCGCLGSGIRATLSSKIAVLAGITFLSATGLRSDHADRSRSVITGDCIDP